MPLFSGIPRREILGNWQLAVYGILENSKHPRYYRALEIRDIVRPES